MPVRLPALNLFHTARPARGFTLLELLVVISIMALATAGVSIALRDNGQTVLEREGARLAALLESGRAQSRAHGQDAAVQRHARAEQVAALGVRGLDVGLLGPGRAAAV